MTVLETSRLTLREFTPADAAFIVELVNDPAWLRHIGDRGVHSPADARDYLHRGPLASYARHGFGLWMVERKADGAPLGMCGLLKRDTLPGIDLGFAFLERFRGQGYAAESAAAALDHARRGLGLKRVLAITSPGNAASIRLLEKLGLRFETTLQLSPGDEVKLFAIDF